MGSGKSRIGRELSKYLNCPFTDLDWEITQNAGLSIKEIFAQQGEAYFRLLERRSLHDTLFQPPGIIATGGGAPCFFNNMEWINQQGIAIFLDASPQVLTQRLWKGRKKRPLIMSLGPDQLPAYITKKLAERKSFYELASVHYSIDDPLQDSGQDLYQKLNYIVGH